MLRVVLVAVIGLGLAASFDPNFMEWLRANSRNILVFFTVLFALFMLTGTHSLIHAFLESYESLTIHFAVAAGYGFGALGLGLMYRSAFLPDKRRQYVVFLIGLMLIGLAWNFISTIPWRR